MSLACWFIVDIAAGGDVVDDDVAAAWALPRANSSLVSGVSLVIALGEDVKDELVQRAFVGLAGVERHDIAVCHRQSEGCRRHGSQRLVTVFAFAFAFCYDGGVFWSLSETQTNSVIEGSDMAYLDYRPDLPFGHL